MYLNFRLQTLANNHTGKRVETCHYVRVIYVQRETETCTFTSEDLDLDVMDLEHLFDIRGWSCSRPADNGEWCIWHTDTIEKNQEALTSEIGEGDLCGALVVDTDLSGLSFLDATGLVDADLTGADLRYADLTDADRWSGDVTATILLSSSTRSQ